MKIMGRKLAMPLLGVLLWVISIHAGTFAAATLLLPRPLTGVGRSLFYTNGNSAPVNDHPITFKIPEKDLNRSVAFGSGVVNRLLRLETNLGWSNIHVKKGTPSHGQYIVSQPDREALNQGKDALVATKATIHLMNNFCFKHGLTRQECSKYMSKYSFVSTPLESACLSARKQCTSQEILSDYRSIDGSCNHRNDGTRGASFTAYKRLVHPEYLDGVQELRRSVNKKALPSSRLISSSLVKAGTAGLQSDLTLAVMQWSQFIEHDLSHTATSKMVHTDNTIECCATSGNNLSPRYIHPFCSPISVPHDDKFYAQHGLDCMTYVRSIPALKADCSFGPIEQVNQATHFLDGSQIYGTTPRKSIDLRSFVNGQLHITQKSGRDFLPLSHQPTEDCQSDNDDTHCFVSGDSRVNTHPQLTAMHTLWVREHNRIAEALAELNPRWDDERLYQEARRIVVAEIQHISFDEWIPQVLGRKYHQKMAQYDEYSESINPEVSNSFATAALRVVNSFMDGKLKMYKENRLVNKSLSLREHFNKPDIVEEPGYLDALVRGLATQTSQKRSSGFVEDISGQLYSNGAYGFDVFSLDIQRGRDHGLPGYVTFRSLCGLPEAQSFEDLLDVMPMDSVKSLSSIYSSPLDIDLIVGGMSETPTEGSVFGPTFSCIVADQFLRTRRGDRYFYTNEDQPAPFSKAQIREIEKVTLARIFCDDADHVERMQTNVFRTISERNPLVDCKDLPSLNLRVFLDTRETHL